MRNAVTFAAAALFSASVPLTGAPEAAKLNPAAKTPAASSNETVNTLSEAELTEVITLLKENFIKPEMLSDVELKRATVSGLLARLAPGVALLQKPGTEITTESPFRAETLDNRFGYVRLGATNAANLAELDAAFAKFAEKAIGALVIDLRATPASSAFEQTAEVCRRFVPKGKVLFTVKKPSTKQEQVITSKDEPKFKGIITVLVDHDTAGNAEVIAAVLRTHVNALVIGQRTKGEAVEFSDLPLAGGKLLRVAAAEVTLPENVVVFPGGVKPDLVVDVPPETTEAVLAQGLTSGVNDLVFETERARMNEAALVAGTNPELDAIQAAQANKGERPKAPLRDAVLQRAVDFLTTLAIYEKKPKGK
jgi:hypothetical protein